MGMNIKNIEKYSNHYKNLDNLINVFEYIDENDPRQYNEIWLPMLSQYIPNILDGYYISNYGRAGTCLKSPLNPNGEFRILHDSLNSKGYHQIVFVTSNGKRSSCKTSRAVMLHFKFIKGCERLEVDHINGDKNDNSVWNLEWVTPQENTHRAIVNGQRSLGVYNTEFETLLSDKDAYELYNKAKTNNISISQLASEYKVSETYIDRLCKGTIRPYIAGYYYNRSHITM